MKKLCKKYIVLSVVLSYITSVVSNNISVAGRNHAWKPTISSKPQLV